MTFGGQVILTVDQFKPDLFKNDTVRPFLDLDMDQISFKTVLLEENQIFVIDFGPSISVTPACAATHLPLSIYDYMDENFFRYLCYDNKMQGDFKLIGNYTSFAAPMKSCQCDGENFYGMPSIEFGLQID
eukprot:CAMPEP_0170451608 /NCGR_PEP_ID=MMETSP0123-20130129/789_1 /TAXON_ID=182087 /ORGANISM="Favella ehrenbergii, Strain Fehren 1" /LENGTH=129 /DNA_ID=CAMNT_0010713349 /DNA_START=549 /DNA_END=938 /DNA_ORIENTATION=-